MPSKIKDKKGPKGLSIFHRLLISYLGVGIIIVVITGAQYYLREQKAIKEDLKSQFLNTLNSSIAYFDRIYTARIKEDLNFIEKSSAFNSFLSSQKDEILLTKSFAEQLFLHFTDRPYGIYLSTRFIDSKGMEKVITSGNKRLRDYVSLDNFPPTDILHSKIYTLFKRLKPEKIDAILFEGPFEYGGKFTFLIGIPKNEPEVGGFAGVVIFHCDLTDYFNHLDGYVFHNEHVASVLTLDGEQIFVPEPNNPPVYQLTNLPKKENPLSFYSVSDTVKMGSNNQVLFKVVFSISSDIFRTELRNAFKNSILYISVIMVLVVILALVMSKQFSTPLVGLVISANRLAKGDLSTRVNVNANGEIGLLVDSFNNMVEDLQKTTVSRDELVKEITERQQIETELKKKMQDLEEFKHKLEEKTQDLSQAQEASLNMMEDLQEAKTYIDNVMANLLDSLIVTDINGIIRTVNKITLELLGYKEEELVGRPFGMVTAQEVLLNTVLEKGEVRNLEATYKTKDNRLSPMLFSGSLMGGKDGEAIGIVGIAKDISERKKMEEKRMLLMRDLEEMNRVMTGRELKMIELKKEVNKLNEELDRPKPYDVPLLEEAI